VNEEPRPEGAEALALFLLGLRRRGLRDARLLKAIERAPREHFLEPSQAGHAYRPIALPIACGQEATPPDVIVRVLEALAVGPRDRVLEIGTGTGYQTALLGELGAEVVSVERSRHLAQRARSRLVALGLKRIVVENADGSVWLAQKSAFQRIVVNASCPQVPKHLMALLTPGGRMVLPLGTGSSQRLAWVTKGVGGLEPHREGAVEAEPANVASPRFAPLLHGLPIVL